jgi:hypothetical protein
MGAARWAGLLHQNAFASKRHHMKLLVHAQRYLREAGALHRHVVHDDALAARTIVGLVYFSPHHAAQRKLTVVAVLSLDFLEQF